MDLPRIIAMYRVKNEERWIQKSLDHTSQICKEIVILDDGSTDDTLKICKNHKNVVDVHHQEKLPFDDTRDKNTLLQMALKRDPDFLFTIDGDQIIQFNADKILFEEIHILFPETQVFEFKSLFMYEKPNQYRYDGIYNNHWTPKLIRMSDQPENLNYSQTGFSGNIHCPHIPQNVNGLENSVRSKMMIFHYGNYDYNLRQNKFNFFNTMDPNNTIFDGYRHIISVSESKLSGKHGIELQTLPEGEYIKDIK